MKAFRGGCRVSIALSHNIRASVEQIFRAMMKAFFFEEQQSAATVPSQGRLARRKLLPPCLGEMGMEIRCHIATTEPWLNNGWKVMTRYPAFYPEGGAFCDPEFFAAVDALRQKYEIVSSHGGMHIVPFDLGNMGFETRFEGRMGKIGLSLDDTSRIAKQALAEIEMRKLFLEWFHYEGRMISEYDRMVLSFSPTSVGNAVYRLGATLRPSFLPPAFENPPEPRAAHVGVQIRNVHNGVEQPRNSDGEWMLRTADAVGAHLGLPVLVYGHLDGCLIPEGRESSWQPGYGGDHMARELGYLKSCKLMLSPDSGWADLMAWLEIPTLLEKDTEAFSQLRENFRPRIRAIDRAQPLGPQIDALLACEIALPASSCAYDDSLAKTFPWEP